MSSIQVTLPVPAGNGVGAGVDVSLLAAEKTIVIGGTVDASVTIEVSVDAGVTWAGIATMIGVGKKTIAFAAQQMRVRIDAYSSGTPTVDVGAEATTGNFSAMNVPAADGDGTALDVSAYGWCNTITLEGDPVSSTLNIQVSQDGVDWATIATFSAAGAKVVKFSSQWARVQRVTGGGFVAGTVAISIGATDSGSGGGAGASFNYFGDGSDGDGVIGAGTTFLTSDAYYDNLTIQDNGELRTGGHRLFVRGELSVAALGLITADGNFGSAGETGPPAAGTGGAANAGGTLQPNFLGGGGNVAGAGSAGTAAAVFAGEGSPASGAGGAGASGAGGAGASAVSVLDTQSQTPRQIPVAIDMYAFDRVANAAVGLEGGAGGGGGGGEAGVGGGGGGGAGGGTLVIAAKTIVLAAGAILRANGGAGGDGPAASDTGGGGGGTGGAISLVYETLQDGGATIEAAGGSGGAALGTGVAGGNGAAGTVFQYQV